MAPFFHSAALALCAAALGTAALAGCAISRAEFDAQVRQFRATHTECDPQFFREPCQVGPDGRLYQYLPGEKQN